MTTLRALTALGLISLLSTGCSKITPGSVVVRRSNKDLQVVCKKPGLDVGSANVVSRTKGNMFGNIIFGGGVGAIIDHNNGSAYEYPSLIKIFLGRMNQKIEEKTAP